MRAPSGSGVDRRFDGQLDPDADRGERRVEREMRVAEHEGAPPRVRSTRQSPVEDVIVERDTQSPAANAKPDAAVNSETAAQ